MVYRIALVLWRKRTSPGAQQEPQRLFEFQTGQKLLVVLDEMVHKNRIDASTFFIENIFVWLLVECFIHPHI